MSRDGEPVRGEPVRGETVQGETVRLDRLLWYLRFSKTRSAAQALIAQGHIRIDGRRTDKAGAGVHTGSILVIPFPRHSTVIRILHLPNRRGPAPEAQGCYIRLDAAAATDSQECTAP